MEVETHCIRRFCSWTYIRYWNFRQWNLEDGRYSQWSWQRTTRVRSDIKNKVPNESWYWLFGNPAKKVHAVHANNVCISWANSFQGNLLCFSSEVVHHSPTFQGPDIQQGSRGVLAQPWFSRTIETSDTFLLVVGGAHESQMLVAI